MYIYRFGSILFIGQVKTIISSFPMTPSQEILLVHLVNEDNFYPPEKGWKIVRVTQG